jgi:hypothetical protein
MAGEREGYIRVTSEDLSADPDPPQVAEIKDDYVIVCAGSCYVSHVSTWPKSGTVQLTIKGRR